nr:hypothetical protein [Halobellus sp. ZY16]
MSLDHIETLECTLCSAEYDLDHIIDICPKHEGTKGILGVKYDYDVVADRFDADLDGNIRSQWKYEAFLPVDTSADRVTLNEGSTDLFDAPRSRSPAGGNALRGTPR